jgi:hypothetical protein
MDEILKDGYHSIIPQMMKETQVFQVINLLIEVVAKTG